MKKLHYSWIILICTTLLMFLTVGLASTGFAAYLPFIIKHNGFTNTQCSTMTTMRYVFALVATFFVDGYYRKAGIRKGLIFVLALLTASFVIFGISRSFILYCAAAALSGVAYSMAGMIPSSVLIDRWFSDRKAMALGITAAGSGIASIAAPPAITLSINAIGLAATFFAEAALIFILSAAAVILIRNHPEEKRLSPYEGSVKKDKKRPEKKVSVHKYQRGNLEKKDFIIIFMVPLLLGGACVAGYGHLSVLYDLEGFDCVTISLMLAAAGLILTLGKCVFGYFTDRLGSFRSSNLFGSFLIAGLALCCFAFVPSKGLFMLAMVVLGFGLPLSTVGLSVWAMDFSDMDSYPTVLKWFQLAHSIGGMAFSMVPGIIADIFGSYVPAYILFTGFAVISFLIVFVTYMKQMKKTQ